MTISSLVGVAVLLPLPDKTFPQPPPPILLKFIMAVTNVVTLETEPIMSRARELQ